MISKSGIPSFAISAFINAGKSLHGAFALSILLRGAGAALALAVNVVLARLLGVAEYGSYMTFYSASVVLGILALRGTGQLLVRELPLSMAHSDQRRRALRYWSAKRIAIGALTAAMIYSVWVLATQLSKTNSVWWHAWIAGAILVVLFSLAMLFGYALNGFGASLRSQVLTPVANNIFVLILLVSIWFIFRQSVSIEVALWLQIGGLVFACLVGWHWLKGLGLLRQFLRVTDNTSYPSDNPHTGWARAAKHFFLFSIATVAVDRLDVVLVGGLGGDRISGIYVAGARLAQVAFLVTMAVNTVLSPKISRVWAERDYFGLRQLMHKSLLFTGSVCMIEILVAMLFASDIVKLFGPAYAESASVFKWMVLAYVLWGIPAPAYAMLTMIGAERAVATLSWLILVVNLGAIVILVPLMGANGGAIAMSIGYALVLPILIVLIVRWDMQLKNSDLRGG